METANKSTRVKRNCAKSCYGETRGIGQTKVTDGPLNRKNLKPHWQLVRRTIGPQKVVVAAFTSTGCVLFVARCTTLMKIRTITVRSFGSANAAKESCLCR